MEIPMTVNTTTSIEVDAISDATVALKTSTTKLKTSMNMMGRDMSADSDVKEDLENDIINIITHALKFTKNNNPLSAMVPKEISRKININ